MAGRVDRRSAVAVSMAGLVLTTVAARAATSTGAPDTLFPAAALDRAGNVFVVAGDVSCRDGRQLGDFFQVAVGRDGVANVAWAEDAPAGPATISYARGGLALGSPN
jgi:hypothetical protein